MTESEWLASTDPRPMLEFLRGKVSDRKLRLFAVACCRMVWYLLPDEACVKAVEVAERYADGKASKKELAACFAAIWPAIEKPLADRLCQQGSLPMARELAARAAAATAAVGQGKRKWVEAWLALPTERDWDNHRPPWEEVTHALISAASDEFTFDISTPTQRKTENDRNEWAQAWEQADARAMEELRRRIERTVIRFGPYAGRTIGSLRKDQPPQPKLRLPRKKTKPGKVKFFEDFDQAEEAAYRRESELLRDIICNPFRPVELLPSWLRWNDGTVKKMAQAIYEERRFGDMPILADALEDAGCDNADILRHCRESSEHARGCWCVDLLLGKS